MTNVRWVCGKYISFRAPPSRAIKDGILTSVRIGVYFIFGISALVFIGINIWVMLIDAVPKSSAQLHKQIIHAVMRAPYSYFVKTDSGVILNHFSSDMSLIEGEMAGGVMQSFTGASQCLGQAALIATGATYVGTAIPVSCSSPQDPLHLYM